MKIAAFYALLVAITLMSGCQSHDKFMETSKTCKTPDGETGLLNDKGECKGASKKVYDAF